MKGGSAPAACRESILWSMSSEKRNDVPQTLNYVTLHFLRNSLAKLWSPCGHTLFPTSVCHWAPRLTLPSPKPRNPLCLCPGSTAEGKPKTALPQLGWPPFSAAPAKEELKTGRKFGGEWRWCQLFLHQRHGHQRMTARKGWEQAPCSLLWAIQKYWVAIGKFYYRDSSTA